MIYLNAVLQQSFEPATLPAQVKAALGTPLRRAAGLTQLAVLGALNCLPTERRHLPTALLWQSTAGPRGETQAFLDELAEPMPFTFLATQPAIAAAQLKPILPGLHSATYVPLDSEGSSNWSLLLCLAGNWLQEGRYKQVLCAHLDITDEAASGDWLYLSGDALENSAARLQLTDRPVTDALPDTPDFPAALAGWLKNPEIPGLHLKTYIDTTPAIAFTRT